MMSLSNPTRSEGELMRYWQERATDNNVNSTTANDSLKFAKMFSELIHSGRFAESIIKLESSFIPDVEEMFCTRDKSMDELQTKSSSEIEEAIEQLGKTHTEATISNLSSRYCQDMERLLYNWNMSIQALKDAQKEIFRDQIETLWADLFQNVPGDSESIRDYESRLTEDNEHQIKLEESFTINLGSQLKTAHNLRLLAVDSLFLLDSHRNKSIQVRLQTAMSLYSHNLSAVVLLVDNQFNSYCGIQHDFSQLCNRLTEFHFDDHASQIKHIQNVVLPESAGRRHLVTGDCYTTKHSNLINAHIVFHLVVDDTLKNGEVNSRHPIMSSLRNILRVAHMYDVKTISLPLLLVDEMNEEILTVSWCLKRAELVLKCVKGFLIEMASLFSGVEQGTIQFLVPKGISDELFSSLAALIPEVFRMANSVNLRSPDKAEYKS